MSSGLLGKAAPAANTDTVLYTVPASTVVSFNLSVVNRGADIARVRVAIAPNGTLTNSDWVEFDALVPAGGGVLERTGLAAEATERIIVRDDRGTCSYRAFGFEQGA
jgi:hypothetical protein